MAPRTRGETRRRAITAGERDTRIPAALERLTTLVARLADNVEKLNDDHRIQLKRVAQLQADVDVIKRTQRKMQSGV